jgi:alkylation response protein AidB-like acyl-CoA dehydrogenase
MTSTHSRQHTTICQTVPSSRQDIIQDRAPTQKTDNLSPSSSTAGFFQTPPHILNQFHDDAALRRALKLFLPDTIRNYIAPELSAFGDKVLSRQILSWVLDAERNAPYVKTWDSWGKRRDELVTSEGWRNLQRVGIEEGMVAIPYENKYEEYSRVYHFAKYALWCGSSAWVNCPSLMVDGVATLLRKHLIDSRLAGDERAVFRSAYERLISRDPEWAWTTGQWMTERQGGSDVSMTETLATYSPDSSLAVKATDGNELGPWLINGFKWFSSATDANVTVLLAKTPKGISTFVAPMRKMLKRKDVLGHETELNGVYIQRLKNKLGTRALPTAELELKGMRAWLVGEEGRGTKEIATVLNVCRIHNGVTAIGFWGRGLGIVRAFAMVRVVGRKPLWERTAFMRTLAKMHVEYRANVLFNFFVAGLLGCAEQDQIAAFNGKEKDEGKVGRLPGVGDAAAAEHLLRLLTPAVKGHCSKTAIAGLQECMECMGGVGYLENDDMQFNIARLYRDANVLPIWEGTTDMMADDSVLRVLYGKTRKEAFDAFSGWVQALCKQIGKYQDQSNTIGDWWMEFKAVLAENSREESEMNARTIMTKLVDIVQGLLLLVDAQSDGDEIAQLAVEGWFAEKQYGASSKTQRNWKDQAAADLKIVLGMDGPQSLRPKL